jgi:hypothetical protein
VVFCCNCFLFLKLWKEGKPRCVPGITRNFCRRCGSLARARSDQGGLEAGKVTDRLSRMRRTLEGPDNARNQRAHYRLRRDAKNPMTPPKRRPSLCEVVVPASRQKRPRIRHSGFRSVRRPRRDQGNLVQNMETSRHGMDDGILVRPQRRDRVPLQPPSIAAILIPASPQALAATPAMSPNDLEADRALQHKQRHESALRFEVAVFGPSSRQTPGGASRIATLLLSPAEASCGWPPIHGNALLS